MATKRTKSTAKPKAKKRVQSKAAQKKSGAKSVRRVGRPKKVVTVRKKKTAAVASATMPKPVKLTETQKTAAKMTRQIDAAESKVTGIQAQMKAQGKLIASKVKEHNAAGRKAASASATKVTRTKARDKKNALTKARAKLVTIRKRSSATKKSLRELKTALAPHKRAALVDVRVQKREVAEARKIQTDLARALDKFRMKQQAALEKKAEKRMKNFLKAAEKKKQAVYASFERAQARAAQRAEKARMAPKRKRRRKVAKKSTKK